MTKSFVANFRVSRILKTKEEEKPVKKPPAKPLPAPKKSQVDVIKKKESWNLIKIEQSIDILESMSKNP